MAKEYRDLVARFAQSMESFERTARQLFSKHETAPERTITLTQTKNALISLSLAQGQLFDQAIRCIENRIYRAAHVMAWAAFMDFLEQKLSEDGLHSLFIIREKWKKHLTIEELRENVNEYQILEAAYELKLLKKGELKILKGFLAKRNECAHPSDYRPGLNEALGYVDELLKRIGVIQSRKL